MQPRSTFVTVVAWAALVWSGFRAIGALVALLVLSGVDMPAPPPGVQSDLGWVLASSRGMAVGMLMVSVLIGVYAAGLLRRRDWARRGFVRMLGVLAVGQVAIAMFVEQRLADIAVPLSGPELSGAREILLTGRMWNFGWAVLTVLVIALVLWRLASERVRSEFVAR